MLINWQTLFKRQLDSRNKSGFWRVNKGYANEVRNFEATMSRSCHSVGRIQRDKFIIFKFTVRFSDVNNFIFNFVNNENFNQVKSSLIQIIFGG